MKAEEDFYLQHLRRHSHTVAANALVGVERHVVLCVCRAQLVVGQQWSVDMLKADRNYHSLANEPRASAIEIPVISVSCLHPMAVPLTFARLLQTSV